MEEVSFMRLLNLIFASLLFAALAFGTMSIIPTLSTDAMADHHEKDYDEGDEATEGESGAEAEGAMPGAEEAKDGMEDAAPAP